MRTLSRLERIEALGHTHVESDLPRIVRDWCVGDSVLCLVEGEFQYMDREVWKQLRPFPRERVLAGCRIFAGFVVVEPLP
jgi:hypothetical protein